MFKNFCDKYREVISYLIVGGLTTIVSLEVYYLCVLSFLNPRVVWQLQAANIISWVAAVLFAYYANRNYVFKSKQKTLLKEFIAFVLSRVGTLLMDMAIMFVTVSLCEMDDKIAKLIVQVVVTIGNYVFSKFLVFKKK